MKRKSRLRGGTGLGNFAWASGLALGAACALATPAASAQPAAPPDDLRIIGARDTARTRYPTCTNTSPSAADVNSAKAAHTTAKSAFDGGNYKVAITQWTIAYGFDCNRPAVFKNLALAYEGDKDLLMAIAVTEIYLARTPGEDPAPFNAQIAGWRMALKIPPAPIAGSVVGTPAETKKDPVVVTPLDPSSPDVEMKRPFGPGPWIVFSLGAATAIGGAVVLALGRVDVADAEEQCGGHTNCTPDQIDLGNGGNTLTGVGAGLLGGGVAIAVGGLIWQFVGNKAVATSAGNETKSEGFLSPSVTFDPSFGPGWAGGSFRGTF